MSCIQGSWISYHGEDITRMTSPLSLIRVASTVAPSDYSESFADPQFKRDMPSVAHVVCEIISDVKPFSKSTRSDIRMFEMVEQVRVIGSRAFWGNNCLEDCNKRCGWKLTIIAEPKQVGNEVFGFIIFKIDSVNMVLHVQYIAVAHNHRHRGIGSKLIKHIKQFAHRILTSSTVQKIACACVPDAVKFYQKHSFKKVKRIVANEDEAAGELLPDGRLEQQIDLQYQMEWKVPALRKNGARR